jgi:KaiC/GvpD/RAD55 family RecA-like ATPase
MKPCFISFRFAKASFSQEKYAFTSLKVADLSILYSRALIPTTGSPFPGTGYTLEPDVVRVTDDELVLLGFNDEKSFIDFWRTRILPSSASRKSTNIEEAVKGVYSEQIYKTLEASVDGIIDIKLEEDGKETRDMIRIKSMRNVGFDREWHELKIGDNFEVTLEK